MSNQVKVEDLEVFRLFRVALIKFAQASEQSLTNADGQISRTHAWLAGEQKNYWLNQLRKRSEALSQAKEALRKKKLFRDSSGRTPNAAQEEKDVAHCMAACAQAEQKLEAIRKWLPKLEKANEFYRSGVSRLSGNIKGQIPAAVALLDRLAGSLQEYMQISAPATGAPDSAAALPVEESITRPPEEADNQPSSNADDASPPAENKENRDVTDGL